MHESHHTRQYEVLGAFFPADLPLPARAVRVRGQSARARGRGVRFAGVRLMTAVVREVTDPDDPAIAGFGEMQNAAYFAPETLDPGAVHPSPAGGADRRAPQLSHRGGDGRAGRGWRAVSFSGRGGQWLFQLPRGGALVSPAWGCAALARGTPAGCWSELLRAASPACSSTWSTLRACLLQSSSASARPARTPGIAAAPSSTWASNRWTFATSSPSAARTAGPVTILDLLFCPRSPSATGTDTSLVVATMRAYWSPWLRRRRRAPREELEVPRQRGHRAGIDLTRTAARGHT